LKELINFCLRELSEIDIPVKRGTFLEFRMGMLNLSPVGRNCSQKERDEFEAYDKIHKVRETLIGKLQQRFGNSKTPLQFSVGGQISIDIFPKGWDKTYCLQFLAKDGFNDVHFFGDKTDKGGNDYEIYTHGAPVTGHSVKSPDDTIKLVSQVLETSPKAPKDSKDNDAAPTTSETPKDSKAPSKTRKKKASKASKGV